MKAIWYNKFGESKDVLNYGDVPDLSPKTDEVKVELYYSAVNPSDTKKRNGANPKLLDDGMVVPNSDGAGVIVEVGKKVDSSRIGERVWIFNAQYEQNLGTSAEFVCVPQFQAVPLPDNASYEIGAMMGIPAMTAHRAVFSDGSLENQNVLITGGAGRVGFYAIQWAKMAGATVIATAGNKRSIEDCKLAGADLVAGHLDESVVKEILDFTKGVKISRVIEGDFAANLNPVLDLLDFNAVIATYSSMTNMFPEIPFVRMMFMDITIRMILVYAMKKDAKKAAIDDIYEALKMNKLKHRIAETIDLRQSVKAHELIEQGSNYGCVLLKIKE